MAVQVLHKRGQPWSPHHLSRPSLLGDGLLERARSTSFAMLGLLAAVGLALVALAVNQSWPLLPGGPIPGAGLESALHQAVVAARPPAAKGGAGAPAVAAPVPARTGSSTAGHPSRSSVGAVGPGGASAGDSHGARLGGANEAVPARHGQGSGQAAHQGGGDAQPLAQPPATAPRSAPNPQPVVKPPSQPVQRPKSQPTPQPSPHPGKGGGNGRGNGRASGSGNGKGKGASPKLGRPASASAAPVSPPPAASPSNPGAPVAPSSSPAQGNGNAGAHGQGHAYGRSGR